MWDVVERFCFQLSSGDVTLLRADTACRYESKFLPDAPMAALSRLRAQRSTMSCRVDAISENGFSFGIASAPFAPKSVELLGERIDSWGIAVKGGQSIIGENGEYFSEVANLVPGDILSLDMDLTRQRLAIVKNGAILGEWSVTNTEAASYVCGVTIVPGTEVTILPIENPYGAPAWTDGGPMQATKDRFNSIVSGIQDTLAMAQGRGQGNVPASTVPGSNLEDSIGSIGKMGGQGQWRGKGQSQGQSDGNKPTSPYDSTKKKTHKRRTNAKRRSTGAKYGAALYSSLRSFCFGKF